VFLPVCSPSSCVEYDERTEATSMASEEAEMEARIRIRKAIRGK
jgi:hypothetical protein